MLKRKVLSNNLGEDSILRLMFRLTIPSMLAQLVNVLYGVVDRIFISNIDGIGDIALAGVGVCAPITTLITSFAFLVGLGGAPLMAIYLGAGKKEDAQKTLSNCFTLLLILSAIVIAVAFGLKRYLLEWFGASSESYVYANQYLTVYLIGAVFAILSLGLNVFITSQGFSKVAMASVLIGAILNIILDPIFIYIFKLNVYGAAIATVIAQICSCIWVMLFLMGKRTAVRLSFRGLNFKFMRKILGLGLSPFLIMCTESVILIALNASLQNYGGSQGDSLVAGAAIVISFLQLVVMPLGGITMGAQPLISYNYGAGNTARIKSTIKWLVVFCMVFNGVMLIFANTLGGYFARIFTSNEELIDLAVWGIRVHTAGIFFLSFQYPFVDTLTALNKPKYAIFLSLTRKIGVMLTLTLVLPRFFGAEYAFLGEPIADVFGGILSSIVFLTSINRLLRVKPIKDDNSVDTVPSVVESIAISEEASIDSLTSADNE